LGRGSCSTGSIVVSVLGVEVAGSVSGVVLGDNRAKASLGAIDWAINERKFGNVILVYHRENRFLFVDMNLGVAVLVIVGSGQFTEAIVRDNAGRLLFGLSVESA
jgi:hypothetical protein